MSNTTPSTPHIAGAHSAPQAEGAPATPFLFDLKFARQKAGELVNAVRSDRSVRAASFAFALTRAMVFLVFILTTHANFTEPPLEFGSKAHELQIRLRRYSVPQQLRELATRADGSWYISIARDGYEQRSFTTERAYNWAFFPLYPLAVRAVASLTGNYRLVAIALSNLFFFLALIVLHKMVLAFGYDQALANRAIFYVAAFPTSYFFSLPWTSSLFLLLTASSFLAAKRSWWWLAGVCAGLASATRYNGIFLLPALAIFYWQSSRPFKLRANILWLLLAPAGLLAFMAYLYAITGNALAFADAQAVWKVRWGFFLQPLVSFIISPFELSAGWNFRLLNFTAAVTALVCAVAWLRRREWAWGFYILICIIVPLSTVTLEGHTRYVMVLFPVFVMLAIWGRAPLLDQTIRTIFLVLLTLMTTFFGFFFSPALI